MTNIGLVGAFFGGLLSLVSPCSALLLPSFFAYAFDGIGRLALRTALFYAGLATVLMPLGAGLGMMGSILVEHRILITLISGIVLILLGVLTVLGKGFAFAPAQRAAQSITFSGSVSVFALGGVYGFAGFCSGPLLGSVLTVAISGGSAGYGAILMALYALGMAMPLFVLALLWDRFDLSRRSWLRGRTVKLGPLTTHTTSLASGVLFIAIGILFLLTDGTANLGALMGVDEQFSLQVAAGKAAEKISDLGVLLALVLVALGVLTVRHFRRTRVDTPEIESDRMRDF
ncbi:cytochrome c biogenesis protein CcdA [Rhodococcus erythropolis]|uniref:cytochrome c biogenesis CcdA family protein n=1 Tax=Rhodococcus erythropolis TaxID=1833 RepID=UPI0008A24755|nr:cytochrome c biogenesis CcdA family protein [Rhodococcus erythropolis]MBT1258318.1 cytochrome c biogenesis protein CcdA [Rhodococcus erythropolis]OHF24882.1 cytochrome C biogenesis protein CcdA [Rhodococcus erythropolis]